MVRGYVSKAFWIGAAALVAGCGPAEPEEVYAGEYEMKGVVGEEVNDEFRLVNKSSVQATFEFTVIPPFLSVDPSSGTIPAESEVMTHFSAVCGEEPSVEEHDLVWTAVTTRPGQIRVSVTLRCDEPDLEYEEEDG